MTIVEAARGITGGIDTHRDIHVAAALDPLGRLLGARELHNQPCRLQELPWCAGSGCPSATSPRSASRAPRPPAARAPARPPAPGRASRSSKSTRPNRQKRTSSGKSDPLAPSKPPGPLSSVGRGATSRPKSRDGAVRGHPGTHGGQAPLRPHQARVEALIQMRHLGYSAPEQLRCRLKGLSVPALVAEGSNSAATARLAHPIR